MIQTLRTGFLIFPGFPMACLTSMIEPMRAANEITGTQSFEWQVISETLDKVRSSADVRFEPNATLQEARNLDLIILLAAPNTRFADKSTAGRLRALSRHGVRLGGVSGGIFPLVRTGVAHGHNLAVHWCYRAAFDAEFPAHVASDRVIELSDGLITAAGASAAFDLALHLIDAQLGAGIATEVACWFQHPVMRQEGVSQAIPDRLDGGREAQFSPLVARAVRIFSDHLSDPVGVGQVAQMLGVSPRHIERSFKQATGLSPTRYYRKLRMQAARQIVLYTNDGLSSIAASVGYTRTQTFGKHYQSAFGLTPKEDRNRINLFRVNGNLPIPSI